MVIEAVVEQGHMDAGSIPTQGNELLFINIFISSLWH